MPVQVADQTLDVIVDAAAKLVGDHGFEALSMRRLAKECGVAAMTLYGYVRTKDDVLEALADQLFSTIEPPPTAGCPGRIGSHGLSSRCGRFSWSIRICSRSWRPWRRDESTPTGGRSTASRTRPGLDGPRAVHAFDALVSFTIGSVQREVGLGRSGGSRFPGLRDLPRDEFPP